MDQIPPYGFRDCQQLSIIILLLVAGYSKEEILAFLDRPTKDINTRAWEFLEHLPSANEDFLKRVLARIQRLYPDGNTWQPKPISKQRR